VKLGVIHGDGDARRDQLQPSSVLVVWTAPPGPAELHTVVERVAPHILYLFNVDPGVGSLESFLKRLGGLVQYALNANSGKVSVSRLAAAAGHRDATARKGIEWLAAKGKITILSEDGGELVLSPGQPGARRDLSRIGEELQTLVAETAAYRRYYGQADKSVLIAGYPVSQPRS